MHTMERSVGAKGWLPMGNTELMATVGTTTMADSLTWGKIGKRLVLGGGLILIPFIPGIISKITDIPNQMMERGYEVHWLREPKRKHELKIGKNLFSEGNVPAFISDPEEEVAGND